jgi:RND family efflux transporter MFP subunit
LPSLPAVRVHLAEVRAVTETRQLELPGTVRAYESAALAPKVMGSVQKLSVALGQSVRRGDVLVTLSANEIAAKLAQAEAGLAQAQRDVERETGLLAKGASAAETVRIAEDRRRLMQATVDEARTMLAYATITAPFDGVITRRYVNEGDLAAPGNPLLEMENPALERVEVEVPEGLAAVAAGTPIAVRVGSLELVGRLAEFSPSSDASSRTFLAKIDLPPGAAVRSGQFARVGWPAGEGTALMVPTGAVSAFGQMERVFVAQENRAVLRLVKTGAHRESGVEILSGLNAGERVIADAALPLRDGQPLEVAP